jgi:hypothetical protein
MAIETLIQGSEKLVNIFGYWPSFHDAEVLDLHFWRGPVNPEQKRWIFPQRTLKVHLWELTREVNPQGYLVLDHHTLAALRFTDVGKFKMQGFNQQNSIFGLSIERREREEGSSPYFAVALEPAFGIEASFECFGIEVLDVAPWTDEGGVLA